MKRSDLTMTEPRIYKHPRLGTLKGEISMDDGKWYDFTFSEEQAIGDGKGGVKLVEAGEIITLKSGSLKEIK